MSVTFHVINAPTTTRCCEWCERAREDRDDRAALDGAWIEDPASLSDADWSRVTCDPWCSGETRAAPEGCEVNFANGNARGVLGLLGLPTDDLFGSVEADEVPEILQRVLVASNRRDARAHLDTAPEDGRGPARVEMDPEMGLPRITTGARVIGFGNTDADTMRRLSALRTLFAKAREYGSGVSWG